MKTAHAHLLSALGAELRGRLGVPSERPVRILDIGCGYGQLMLDLLSSWSAIGGDGRSVEVYGYEVYDHRAGVAGYREEMRARLAVAEPSIDWEDRVRFGKAGEAWPFEDRFFDAAISNQVIEHVEDLPRFFAEQERVVGAGAVALHFYPSRETLVEPHSGVPLVHWLKGEGRRRGLFWGSRLGLGKIRQYRREQGRGVEAFCDEFTRYLERYVFFRGNREIRAFAARASRQAGFKYSVALLRRAFRDDWEDFAYEAESRFSRRAWMAPFVCSTLVQRF